MDSRPVILAQLFPAGGVETILYQVQPSNRALFQGLTIANHSGNQDSFKVSLSLLGAATTPKDYVYFNTPILGNDTLLVELDFTMNSSDVIRVVSTNGTCSFTLYGVTT